MKSPHGSLTKLSWICGRTPIPIFQSTGKPKQSSQNCQMQKTRKPTSPDCAQVACRRRKGRETLHTIPETRTNCAWMRSFAPSFRGSASAKHPIGVRRICKHDGCDTRDSDQDELLACRGRRGVPECQVERDNVGIDNDNDSRHSQKK